MARKSFSDFSQTGFRKEQRDSDIRKYGEDRVQKSI